MSVQVFGPNASNGLPDDIREVLRLLENEVVTIILESGEKEVVKVEAVRDNLLVATVDGNCFKFVDIDCICAVLAECKDILDSILKGKKCHNDCQTAPTLTMGSQNKAYGWQLYQRNRT